MKTHELPPAGFEPGTVVRTPTGRRAKITAWLADGRADLHYLDADGGTVSLQVHLLRPIRRAAIDQ